MTGYPGWQTDFGYDPDDDPGPFDDPDELAYLDVALSACATLVAYQEAIKKGEPAEGLLEEAITRAQLVQQLRGQQATKQAQQWEEQQKYHPEY